MKIYKLTIDFDGFNNVKITRGIAAKDINEALELANKYYCGAISCIEQIKCLTTTKEYELAIFVF